MINSFVPPDITNATLWPEPTNAATNYRNQSTAQFTSITNQLNTEVRDKVNEHLTEAAYYERYAISVAQSISNNSATAVVLDSRTLVGGLDQSFARIDGSGRIEFLEAGIYDIQISYTFASNATGIRYGTDSNTVANAQNAVNGVDTVIKKMVITSMSVGGTFAPTAYQNSGGALNLTLCIIFVAKRG